MGNEEKEEICSPQIEESQMRSLRNSPLGPVALKGWWTATCHNFMQG